MECRETLTLEPQAGQESAQATEPKDNFSDDEKALAEHLKIKPELLRLFSKLSTLDVNEPAEDLSMFSELMQEQEQPEESERFDNRKYIIDRIYKAMGCFAVGLRKDILEELLDDSKATISLVEKIDGMESGIRHTCNCLLDIKARAAIALLSELSSIDGVVNVGGYATNILLSDFGEDDVKQARKQFPDDENLLNLAQVFDIARQIDKSESEIMVRAKS